MQNCFLVQLRRNEYYVLCNLKKFFDSRIKFLRFNVIGRHKIVHSRFNFYRKLKEGTYYNKIKDLLKGIQYFNTMSRRHMRRIVVAVIKFLAEIDNQRKTRVLVFSNAELIYLGLAPAGYNILINYRVTRMCQRKVKRD